MTFVIDLRWRKHHRPVGTGWDYRPKGIKPSSAVIHTTNGNRGSSFEAEADYLEASSGVGAHYLVGQRGQIAEILPPIYRAWHAGAAKDDWINSRSIGIECHHAVGEPWTPEQRAALAWLCQRLMADWTIVLGAIETHRFVALPAGRKPDPSDWTDRSFYDWRAALIAPVQPAGTYPVALELKVAWQSSGGLWHPSQFAPGYALTPFFRHPDGHQYQLFERSGARFTPHGSIEWLFTEDVERLKQWWHTHP